MRLANTADEYGLISKLFHWTMALLMIAVYLLGKNLENNYTVNVKVKQISPEEFEKWDENDEKN